MRMVAAVPTRGVHRAPPRTRPPPRTPGPTPTSPDVATALTNYRKLGITHFILSDTPYKEEIGRIGDQLLPLLRTPVV